MRIRNIIIGGAILSVAVGFIIGKTVVADSPTPGSSADPVVSKSYVDKALQDRVKELEAQVAELTVQSQALQNTINELQVKVNKTTTGKTTTTPSTGGTSTTKPSTDTTPGTTNPSTGTTNPGTGTTTPSTGSSVVGKTAYVTGDGNVNLRQGPSTNDAIIAKVTKADALTILQTKVGADQKNWYQVSLQNGTIGWIAGWLVEVK